MPTVDVARLDSIANTLRQDVVKMLTVAGSGHPGGSLGMADVFAALYFEILKHDPNRPDWTERDRMLLSNGHICPIWYAALARAGYFDPAELGSLRKLGSRLQGHPHNTGLPGVENSGGPLGQGLSVAVGMALAARLDRSRRRIYCAMSDGEHNEGQVWEAKMFAGKHKLSNLTTLIDRNNIQIDGYTEDVMPLEPFRPKIEAFGWNVLEVDGHNIREIIDACRQARAVYSRPTAVICHTIPGKGVSFMEHEYDWHGRAPSDEEADAALRELKKARERLDA